MRMKRLLNLSLENLQVGYNTVNSEDKPRGLYFSKALFEGLMFGGAYIRIEVCTTVSKSARLGKFAS